MTSVSMDRIDLQLIDMMKPPKGTVTISQRFPMRTATTTGETTVTTTTATNAATTAGETAEETAEETAGTTAADRETETSSRRAPTTMTTIRITKRGDVASGTSQSQNAEIGGEVVNK